jgi:hypothetical protein
LIVGRWEDGKMRKWENGKMGRWEDGKMGRWEDENMGNAAVPERSRGVAVQQACSSI